MLADIVDGALVRLDESASPRAGGIALIRHKLMLHERALRRRHCRRSLLIVHVLTRLLYILHGLLLPQHVHLVLDARVAR